MKTSSTVDPLLLVIGGLGGLFLLVMGLQPSTMPPLGEQPITQNSPMPMLEDPEAQFVENWTDYDVWADDEATATSKCREEMERLERDYHLVVSFLGVKRRNNAKFFCGFKFEQTREAPDDDK